LHASGFLRFLAATAPERIEVGFHATDAPGNPKYLMKGMMLQQIYAQLGRPVPKEIANLVLPRVPEHGRNCGPWCVWTARCAPREMALQVNPRIAEIDWSPIEDLSLDFYWRYCPLTARLIPADIHAAIIDGFHAADVEPYTARDYEELGRVRQFVVAVNPPGAYAPE
jgi:hypothetical protein